MLALAKGEIQLIFGPNVFLILLCFAFKWLHLVEGGWLGSIWQFHGQSQDIVDSTCGTYVGEKLFAFFFFCILGGRLIKRQLCAKNVASFIEIEPAKI